MNISFTPLILKPGSLPPPITKIELLYVIAANPCLDVGIFFLFIQVSLVLIYCSLLSNVFVFVSPPNTKILSPIDDAVIPPLFDGIGDFLNHLSSIALYASFVFMLLDKLLCLPPIMYNVLLITPDAKCSLGVGIGALVSHSSSKIL